ncbi:hypothetical protein [Aminicella lysinilytica]|uniref:Uncharacterized protein n=1 Tax=Aminicella lysinilytica TaxID=433323 RepID=A0A4R6PWW5_9FIRM|nr:hypothetical protein [Aminicella lysinilytica]TDP48628.1 hypothetical protein EV211_1506 [Aminicella lysinilytica]
MGNEQFEYFVKVGIGANTGSMTGAGSFVRKWYELIKRCIYGKFTSKGSYRPGLTYCYTNGKSVKGKAWTYSKKYKRMILKSMPESKVR